MLSIAKLAFMMNVVMVSVMTGKSYCWKGLPVTNISTVDLLVLTSLDRPLFILKILFTFFIKQPTLMRRSTVLSLPPSVSIPWSWRHLD
jgi:hypothetical protein